MPAFTHSPPNHVSLEDRIIAAPGMSAFNAPNPCDKEPEILRDITEKMLLKSLAEQQLHEVLKCYPMARLPLNPPRSRKTFVRKPLGRLRSTDSIHPSSILHIASENHWLHKEYLALRSAAGIPAHLIPQHDVSTQKDVTSDPGLPPLPTPVLKDFAAATPVTTPAVPVKKHQEGGKGKPKLQITPPRLDIAAAIDQPRPPFPPRSSSLSNPVAEAQAQANSPRRKGTITMSDLMACTPRDVISLEWLIATQQAAWKKAKDEEDERRRNDKIGIKEAKRGWTCCHCGMYLPLIPNGMAVPHYVDGWLQCKHYVACSKCTVDTLDAPQPLPYQELRDHDGNAITHPSTETDRINVTDFPNNDPQTPKAKDKGKAPDRNPDTPWPKGKGQTADYYWGPESPTTPQPRHHRTHGFMPGVGTPAPPTLPNFSTLEIVETETDTPPRPDTRSGMLQFPLPRAPRSAELNAALRPFLLHQSPEGQASQAQAQQRYTHNGLLHPGPSLPGRRRVDHMRSQSIARHIERRAASSVLAGPPPDRPSLQPGQMVYALPRVWEPEPEARAGQATQQVDRGQPTEETLLPRTYRADQPTQATQPAQQTLLPLRFRPNQPTTQSTQPAAQRTENDHVREFGATANTTGVTRPTGPTDTDSLRPTSTLEDHSTVARMTDAEPAGGRRLDATNVQVAEPAQSQHELDVPLTLEESGWNGVFDDLPELVGGGRRHRRGASG